MGFENEEDQSGLSEGLKKKNMENLFWGINIKTNNWVTD